MDFATRDNYRHAIERLAKQAGMAEVDVAAQALAMAQEPRAAADGGLDVRTRHVGYYLVGNGLPALEQRIKARWRAVRRAGQRRARGAAGILPGRHRRLHRAVRGQRRRSTPGAMASTACCWHCWCILAAIGASQLALALVNFMATQLTRPHPLPRMDFSSGLPDDAHTIVVVPTLIYSPRQHRHPGGRPGSALSRQPRSRACAFAC